MSKFSDINALEFEEISNFHMQRRKRGRRKGGGGGGDVKLTKKIGINMWRIFKKTAFHIHKQEIFYEQFSLL